jgi:hypothetical protein
MPSGKRMANAPQLPVHDNTRKQRQKDKPKARQAKESRSFFREKPEHSITKFPLGENPGRQVVAMHVRIAGYSESQHV